MANGEDQNQGNQNQGANQNRGRRGDREERRPESQFTSEDLNELTTSIYFLESTLNEAVQKSEALNDQLGNTLFDQAFMETLNQNLDRLGSATSKLSDQMEAQAGGGSVDRGSLNVASNINSLDQSINDLISQLEKTPAGTNLNFSNLGNLGDSVNKAVRSGIEKVLPDALQSGLGNMLSRYVPNFIRNKTEKYSFQSDEEDRYQSPPESFRYMFDDLRTGAADIKNLLGAAVAEFPDFIAKANLSKNAIAALAGKTQITEEQISSLQNVLENEFNQSVQNLSEDSLVYQQRLEQFESQLQSLENMKGIDLSDILTGNITEETENFNQIVQLLGENFEEEFGESTTKILQKLQGMSDKAKDIIRQIRIDPATFGSVEAFQRADQQLSSFQSKYLEVLSQFDSEEQPEFIEAISDSLGQSLNLFKELNDRGANTYTIQQGISNLVDVMKEDYADLIDKNENFEKILVEINENFADALGSIKRSNERLKSAEVILGRWVGWAKDIKEKYDEVFDFIQNGFQNIKEILKEPTVILAGVASAIAMIYRGMVEIDSATQQVAEATGLIPARLQEAQTVISDIGGPLMARGQDMNEIAGAVTAIYDNFQSLEIAAERFGVTGENVTEQTTRLANMVGTVATSLNVSNDEAAQMIGTMQALTSTTGKQLEDQLVIAKTLADQAELAPKAVFQDISEASEQIAKFGAVTGEEIARAAVEARSFGSNLQEVLNIAEGLRGDITGTITGLQRAELMLGQPIDELKLLRASFKGPEASAKALRETITSLDLDLDGPLAAIQLEPLADALGISIARMREMQETSRAARKSIGDLVVAGNLAALEEKFSDSQSAIQKFQNSIQSAFFTLKQMIAGPLLKFANPYLTAFGELIQDINTWLSDLSFEDVGNWIGELKEKIIEFGEAGDQTERRVAGFATAVVDLVIYLRDSIPEIKAFGMSMIEAGKGVAKVMTALAPVLELVGDTISWVFEGSWAETAGKIGLLTGAFFTLRKGLSLLGPVFSMAGSSLIGFGRELASKIPLVGTIAKKLGGFASSTSTAAGAAGKSTSVFKSFGVQLAAVAGSVFLVSEAMQNFAELEAWEMKQALVGLTASLIGLTAAMYGINAALSSFSVTWPKLAGAAGVLLAFGSAVWLLSDAMEKFAEAGMEGVKVFGATAAAVGLLGGALSVILASTGGVSGAVMAGAAGIIGLFGGALMIVAEAMKVFGEASNSIVTAAKRLEKLNNVDVLANKLRMLIDALTDLPDASFTDFLAGLVGEGVSDKLQAISDLAKHGEKLKMVPDYIKDMSEGLEGFEVPDDLEDTFDEIGDAIRELPSDTWFSENIITSLHGLIENSDKFEQLKQNITGIGSAAEEIKPIDPAVVSNFTQQVSSMASVVSQVRTAGEGSGLFSQDIGDTISPLNELAGKADSMKSVAGSLESIAQSIQRISNIDLGQSIDQIQRLGNATTSRIMGQIDVMARRNQAETTPEPNQQNATITPEPTESTATIEEPMVQTEQPSIDENYKNKTLENDQQVIEQLNQMIDLQRNLVTSLQNGDIAVYLDGREVTDQLLRSSKKQVARG